MSTADLEAEGPAPTTSTVVAFFDVDNTLMRGASAYHLVRGLRARGVLSARDIVRFGWHQLRFIRHGENMGAVAGLRERALELISGRSENELGEVAEEIYDDFIAPKLWPETVELAREHLRKGHEVWLITATPQAIAEVIAARLGLTGALGTRIESENGLFTGRLLGPLLHGPEKASEARRLTAQLRAELGDCWAYSDSRNDLPLLELVGNRVVVNPDVALARHALLNGWARLELKPASIRAAQRRVRRDGRMVRRAGNTETPGTRPGVSL